MISFSNHTYEPSLGSRPGAGKPVVEDANVSEVLLAKIQQMRADVLWMKRETNEGKQPGCGANVIGNSIIQGLEIRTDQILGDIARQHGLWLEGIHRKRGKRAGASITQSFLKP